MEAYSLIDPLNLKGLIGYITDFVRDNNHDSDMKTALSFLKYLFKDFQNEEINGFTSVDNAIVAMQKLFSGNIPPQKIEPLAEQILSEELDPRLRRNIGEILSPILHCANYRYFFQDCIEKARGPYFKEEIVSRLESLYRDGTAGALNDFMLLLVKHGFQTLHNIPCFAAKRFYDEAQTYDYDQPLRFSLLKIAADYGNKDAALEYGNYINRTRPDGVVPEQDAEIAFEYTLKALPLAGAMWNLAYQLESLQLTPEQIRALTAAIKIDNKLSSDEILPHRQELDAVTCQIAESYSRTSYQMAYKINFYLGYSGFSKSFNSLSKYLSQKRYGFCGSPGTDSQQVDILIRKYSQLAMAGGNVISMQSMALQIFKQAEKDPQSVSAWQYEYAERLLMTAALSGMKCSIMTLGKFYAVRGGSQSLSRAKSCFRSLLDSPMRGEASYRLGLIVSSHEEKHRCFSQAVEAGYSQAVYSYAMEEYEKYRDDSNLVHIHDAIHVIEQNYVSMPDDLRDKASSLREILLESLKRKFI